LILWDKAILTDLTVAANWPNIVFDDLSKHTLLPCPCDSNITLKQLKSYKVPVIEG